MDAGPVRHISIPPTVDQTNPVAGNERQVDGMEWQVGLLLFVRLLVGRLSLRSLRVVSTVWCKWKLEMFAGQFSVTLPDGPNS